MASVPPPPPLPVTMGQDCKSENSLMGESGEESCNRFLCDLNSYVKKTITKIRPIAQTGPNCGLAALAMVSSLTPYPLSIPIIFEKACIRRFTNHGEMFSALNMKNLADDILSPWFKVDLFTDGLEANKTHVIDRLHNGDLMLVPYDADHNHSPCCSRGHNAHWALVCGVLMAWDGKVCVAARQGKSKYLAVWPLDTLQQSNDNLMELDPKRVKDEKEYVIPAGGVKEGLASTFILIEKVKST
ncbi:UPF0692 protein C19orf54 homolog [Homalodisca vitripennis]|uniref:UPF0692 protein C19orf54 homolog n=1 Tax=Homalodisca vitripennis TaxID=197043 RepID=UPI001EEA7BEC|nr:UPF0692 protein C19orf54 homolog [Homalodisca vitripennis]